jgi:hypothetical protein
MRFLAILALASVPLRALDNSVTITDASGVAQTNRPISVSRVFAKGEIAACAGAFVDGVATATQTDVKTRWSDGSLQHAVVTFQIPALPANGAVVVDFRNSANCNNSGMLSLTEIQNAVWNAEIEADANGVTYTVNAKTMLASLGAISHNPDALKARYWLKGPLVTQVIIEDRDPGSRAFDFGWEWDPTLAAWKAPTQAKFQSMHPIYVVTLYPLPGGGRFVRVEYILENAWTDRFQTQKYTFLIRGNSAAPLFTYQAAPRNHIPRTRWRISRWVSNAPGDVHVDYNLPYLIHSKAIPSFDLSKVGSATSMSGDITAFDNGNPTGEPAFCIESSNTKCSLWTKTMGNAGGRKDIGIIPGWYVQYLFSMRNPNFTLSQKIQAYQKLLVGLADAAEQFPHHYREALTDRCYVRADGSYHGADPNHRLLASGVCGANAQGRALSLDARPTFGTTGTIAAPDQIVFACTSTTDPCKVPATGTADGNFLTNDRAHVPDFFYVPYLITGDWYFLEGLYYQTAFYLAAQNANPAATINSHDWNRALLNDHAASRGVAWTFRTAARTAMMAPDGTPEKAHFTQKVRYNAALRLGVMNVATGSMTPSDGVYGPIWNRGRNTIALGKANPLFRHDIRDAACDLAINEGLQKSTCLGASQFMEHYHTVAFGHAGETLADAIPEIKVMAGRTARFEAAQASTVTANWTPFMGAEFHIAIMTSSTAFEGSLEAIAQKFATTCTLSNTLTPTATSINCTHPTDWLNFQVLKHIRINNEIMQISSTSVVGAAGGSCPSGCTYTLNVSRRGELGTIAASHSPGVPVTQLYIRYGTSQASDGTGGYPNIYKAAAAFGYLEPSGRRAWEWLAANEQVPGSMNGNAQWALTPREEIERLQVQAGGPELVFTWVAPFRNNPCGIAISTAPIDDSRDSSDLVIPADNKARRYVATGLTPSTSYFYRLTCGQARIAGITATGTAGGATTLPLALSPPVSLNATHAVAFYGATASLGNVTPPVACNPSCLIQVPATAGRALHYRVEYRNASGAALATGGLEAVIAP